VLLEIQHQSGDPQEFLEHVKVDLPDGVYVFTPKGGSCRCRAARPVDLLACTDIGNAAWRRRSTAAGGASHRRAATTGVEIITASHAKPIRLAAVRAPRRRVQHHHFLKTMQYEGRRASASGCSSRR
jgi:GTP pyrophosphokinase